MPLNLLRNDRSILTTDEWNLLSNIIHVYDATNIISRTRYLLDQQSSLPLKLRSKPAAIMDAITNFYSTFDLVMKRTPYFQSLSTNTYETLIRNNFHTFGSLNCIFTLHEINALDYPAFPIGFQTIYGENAYEDLRRYITRLDSNGTFIGIMLFYTGVLYKFSFRCI